MSQAPARLLEPDHSASQQVSGTLTSTTVHKDPITSTAPIEQSTTSTIAAGSSSRVRASRSNRGRKEEDLASTLEPPTKPVTDTPALSRTTRRSARLSVPGNPSEAEPVPTSRSKGKKRASIEQPEEAETSSRRAAKGKKRAAPEPLSPRANAPHLSDEPQQKRIRRQSTRTQVAQSRLRSDPADPSPGAKGKRKGKGPAVIMPKRQGNRSRRPEGASSGSDRLKKGNSSSKLLIDDPMDDEHWIDESSSSRQHNPDQEDDAMGASGDEDDEDQSGEDEDDEDQGGLRLSSGRAAIDRLARLAGEGGMHLDEATAAALFSGEFRAFGSMLSGLASRFKRLKSELRSPSATVRLTALRECSELLLVSNEDTLGGAFSTNAFATEFIAILDGKPNIDKEGPMENQRPPDDIDEDAQLAAALALSTGGEMPGLENEDEMECQLVACRCLAHLMEALPGSGHTLVNLGAVPVLCSKLNEISYIELAEQTLSTMEKISAEYPGAIVKEGGLGALLNYLPFFSTTVQRTAVTAAANCCRNISTEHFSMVREVFPTLRETLTTGDQRLVEQATLAVVRTLEAYRHSADNLDGLLDLPTVVAINSLLMPSGGSPLLSPSTYTHLLKALVSAAKGSAGVSIAFLEAGMTNTIYQILTGVLPPAHDEDEQGGSSGGQGLSGGIADMAVLQNLAHRPKDQVEESLALVCELMPPVPRDGVFDSRGYSERSLAKLRKTRKSERMARRSSVQTPAESPAGPSTPKAGNASLPSAPAPPADENTPIGSSTVRESILKAKREAEVQLGRRLQLLKENRTLISRFIKSLVPVLVDVYAASIATRVRTKVLSALVRAIAYAGPEELKSALATVPMASFLGAIISSKDNPAYVLQALQLVELLATKLPDVYATSFLREGVVFEIENLAAQDLTPPPKAESPKVKAEPDDSTLPPMPSGLQIPEDLKPLLNAAGVPSLSTFLAENAPAPSAPKVKAPAISQSDANILRARVLGAKKIFDVGGDHHSAASAVFDDLSVQVKQLCGSQAKESELRDALTHIAARFADVGQALSSFEMLKSGLVDGLLEYVDVDGVVPSDQRRALLYEIFSQTTAVTSSPLVMLVKRLHESLGRLETFEVETAFGGMVDTGRPSSGGLGRTMRIRLQAEEGQNIPKPVSNISVTIQAIAPFQALHDYLRPRVADGNFMSNQAFSGLFSSSGGIPIPRMGGSTSTSRLLSALAGAVPPPPGSNVFGGPPNPTVPASAPESTRQPVPAPTDAAAAQGGPPQRRRSARLSGANPDSEAATAGPDPPSAPAPALSSSAPEPSILPSMPMDMDFDEDYSDDDYDAEVFEEEMDEEINRPQERVVNMSVAPDGSKVEAKTPDGTRVATPSQNSTLNTTGASAATKPLASYAGALKAPPSDWHLEFSFNGVPVGLEDTIYGAVHKHQPVLPGGQFGGSTFGAPVCFKFKKVEGPASSKPPAEAPSPASEASALPGALDPSAPTSKILRLLRVVHTLFAEHRDLTGKSEDGMDENLFINNKLTAKLTRQLEETMIIASNCLPEWATELPRHFSFLFPFDTRYNFLQATSFGYQRLLARSSNQNRSNNRRDDFNPFGRIGRQKVRISRAQLLESCVKVMELYGTSGGILEVEYFDEIGTGLGPTLEFYSIASKEFARRTLKIWRDEDESKPGTYVFHPRGLFPAPVGPEEQPASVSGSRMSWYKILGLFVGRALLDSRIIDVNLNTLFLRLILGIPVKKTIGNLKLVDPALARSLERLQNYAIARKEIEALQLPASTRRNKLAALTVGDAKLADLSLDFTLPGYSIDLKPRGAFTDVDDSNLEEYIEKVLDLTLGSGIMAQVRAFREGFSMIFPITDLGIFSSDELGVLFGNAEEDWSKDVLEQAIKADHGYTSDSRAVQNLIEVMSGYTQEQRRHFLQFITGAPKLPIGGFRGLQPPFTVVRKPHEAPFKADDYLPSVMTCAQYLKMPDYSTKEILAAQLQRAMQDGGGSFHLS